MTNFTRARRWLRRRSTTLVLGVSSVAATATGTTLTAVDAPTWSRVLGALAFFGCGAGIEIDKARSRRDADRDALARSAAAEENRLRELERCVIWPAPQLRNVDPFQRLGVHPSELGRRYTREDRQIPPYVLRDIDVNVRRRLRGDGMVLLIGAPASGVTRTAYELALTVPGNPQLLAPTSPEGLSMAVTALDVIARFEPKTGLLLWLDNIDAFTDLTPELLYRIRQQSSGLRIIATISSTRYELWSAGNQPLAGAFGDPIRLERLPSGPELQRAANAYPGVDFGEGIAATFMVTAALLAKRRGGFHGCPFEVAGDECALARAVVDVALDWASTDISYPISLEQLRSLAKPRPGGRRIADDHLTAVLDWAGERVLSGGSLLTVKDGSDSEQSVAAAAQMDDIHRAEAANPDTAVWSAAHESALQRADSAAIGRIGFRAHTLGNRNAATQAWAAISSIDEPAAASLRDAAAFSNEQADSVAQLAPRQRLYELSKDAHGDNDIRVIRTLSELGAAHLGAGDPARASELLQSALASLDQDGTADYLDMAATLSRLSLAWISLGKTEQARELLARLAQKPLENNSTDELGTAETLGRLAQAHHLLGDYADSRDALLGALDIQEKHYGPNHPVVAVTLAELSNPLNALGNYPEARKGLDRARTIQEHKLSPDHPDIAITELNLGNTLVRMGDTASAREPLERALRIQLARLGPDSLQVATTRMDLGIMWIRAGDPAKGRTFLENALETQQRQLGRDHPDLTHSLMHLSDACFSLRDFQTSRTLLERTRDIQERQLDADHPDLARTLTRLAHACEKCGEPDENVLPLLMAALGILRKRFPDGHPLINNMRLEILRIVPGAIVFDNGTIARGTTDPNDLD